VICSAGNKASKMIRASVQI